jgi:hypothetical protein
MDGAALAGSLVKPRRQRNRDLQLLISFFLHAPSLPLGDTKNHVLGLQPDAARPEGQTPTFPSLSRRIVSTPTRLEPEKYGLTGSLDIS